MLSWLLKRNKNNPILPKNYLRLVDTEALKIVKALQKGGFESYLVGGCVRDLLLDVAPKDFDIATSASPQKVKNLISRSFIIGRRFRIVVAKRRPAHEAHHDNCLFPPLLKGGKAAEKEIQITTFRRAPEMLGDKINENVFGTSRDDAFRRDFTVNGLFFDPHSGKIVDHIGGLDDIKNKHLRIIGDPRERFEEDPIRILRALRFAARNHFTIESKTQKALIASIPSLGPAKKERIREEILKFLKESTAEEGFEELYKLGIWKLISPKWHEFLASDTETRQFFFKACGAISDWDVSFGAAPLFYIFLLPLTRKSPRPKVKVDEILAAISEDLKLSRIEREEIQHIHSALQHLMHKKDGYRLVQKESLILKQIQFSWVLHTLSKIDPTTWSAEWEKHEKPWVAHTRWILATLKKHQLEQSAAASQGGSGKSHTKRRRRRPQHTKGPGSGPTSRPQLQTSHKAPTGSSED